MHLSTILQATLLSASTLILPSLCSSPKSPDPVLANFYPAPSYGGGEYYVASGNYSTCYSLPSSLEKVIKSLKLGPNVKECILYEDADCEKGKGGNEQGVYKKDEPNVKLTEVESLKCEGK